MKLVNPFLYARSKIYDFQDLTKGILTVYLNYCPNMLRTSWASWSDISVGGRSNGVYGPCFWYCEL